MGTLWRALFSFFGRELMKKIISLLLLIAMLSVCLTSCIVVKGTPGLSAYDIAVQNGFTGSQQEWLDSLKSPGVVEGETTINQTINQDITKNEITIDGEAIDLSFATNAGLRSVVSVICSFTSKSYSKPYTSAGSGVIYKINDDSSALVITNYHVVYDNQCSTENKISDQIKLYLFGGETENGAIDAKFVGGSMNYDIAILEIENSDIFKEAVAGGSVCQAKIATKKLYAGDTVIAIGNPEAHGISATTGVVSVDSEYITMTGADELTSVEFRVIRTDTAINSGNSGGGLFNTRGELVGIVNAKIMSTDVENIGYAIPVGVASTVSDNIIHYCLDTEIETVMRVTIGVSVQVVSAWSSYNAETGMLDKFEKSEVVLINEGSLADGVFELGDKILSITIGEKTVNITRQYEIIDTILSARAGDIIKTKVLTSAGEEKVREITISDADLKAYK